MERKRVITAAVVVGTFSATALWFSMGSRTPTDNSLDVPAPRIGHASSLSGGTLRVHLDRSTKFWQPSAAADPLRENVERLYARTLYAYAQGRYVEGVEVVPDLAAAPPDVSEDQKTYTVHLQSGLEYENGKPVTAIDVKQAIAKALPTSPELAELLAPRNTQSRTVMRFRKQQLQSVTVRGNKTLVFHLSKPSAEFPSLLSDPATSPQPGGTRQSFGSQYPLATGPYRFSPDTKPDHVVFVRNKRWSLESDDARKALPDRIEITLHANDEEFERAWKSSKRPDVVVTSDAKQIKLLKSSGDKRGLSSLYERSLSYVALTDGGSFDDLACRRAVFFASSSAGFRDAVRRDGGKPASGLIPPSMDKSAAGVDPYSLVSPKSDGKDRAMSELKKCRSGKDLHAELAVRGYNPAHRDLAEAFKKSLHRVGITVKIVSLPDEKAWKNAVGTAEAIRKNGFDLVFDEVRASWNSPRAVLQPLIEGRAGAAPNAHNQAQVNDRELRELLKQAPRQPSRLAAADRYKQVNLKAMEKAYYLPVANKVSTVYIDPLLGNAFTHPALGMADLQGLGLSARDS